MSTKQQTIVILVLIISVGLAGCVPGKAGSPLSSNAKPTPKAFTSPVTIGAWVGDISIPLDQDTDESANVRLFNSGKGNMIDYYQLYLPSCSMVIGDHSIPIDQGNFSFSIDQSCDYPETIAISGVFVSEDKLQGTIKVSSQISYWEAAPAE